MATLVVSIICIVMLVTGGVMLTQGILSSADQTAVNVTEICMRESDLSRTELTVLRAEYLTWADMLRVTTQNSGQVKLASFDEWDVFLSYQDIDGQDYYNWLPYQAGQPANNQWSLSGIGLNGPVEFFEPGILNPGEQAVFLAKPYPGPVVNGTGEVNIAAPNGISDTMSFIEPGYTRLVPQAENLTLNSNKYYQMVEAADNSNGMTVSNIFYNGEAARKVLCNEDQPAREARFLFSLAGITEIPAGTWTLYYRCMVDGEGIFPRATGDVQFNIDINVYSADGTLRQTIASEAAAVDFPKENQGVWTTLGGSYEFPGYTVVESTDYLEIVYYGVVVKQGPTGDNGYLYLRVDDSSLPLADQTRMEA